MCIYTVYIFIYNCPFQWYQIISYEIHRTMDIKEVPISTEWTENKYILHNDGMYKKYQGHTQVTGFIKVSHTGWL